MSHNAETVLHYMHPISEDRGFTAEVKLEEVAPEHVRTVRSTLNAGATLDRVQRAGKDSSHYFIHRDLYKTLALIRARTMVMNYGQPQIAARPDGQRYGGSLNKEVPAITQSKALPASTKPVEFDGISDFEADILDHFAMELGNQTDDLERLLRVGQDVDVRAITETLNAALRNDRAMSAQMSKAHQALGESIDSARESFPSDKLADGAQVRTLNGIANELNRLRTLILLDSHGAYRNLLSRMRAELHNDENAGRLAEADAKKLEYVDAHVKELESADLDSKEGWDDVLNSLKSFNYWLSSTASTDQDQPPAGPV